MPQAMLFKVLGFGLILFSVLVALVMLIISQVEEYHRGESFKGVFAFAIAIIGLCAVIALGMISARAQKTQPPSLSFDGASMWLVQNQRNTKDPNWSARNEA